MTQVFQSWLAILARKYISNVKKMYILYLFK